MSNENKKKKMNFFFNDIRHKSVKNRSQNFDGIMILSQICDEYIIPSQVCDGITIPSQFCDRFETDRY